MKKRVLLAGASGLIGGKVTMLLSRVDLDVHVPTRRMLETMPPGTVQHIANLVLKGGKGLFIHENDAMAALAG